MPTERLESHFLVRTPLLWRVRSTALLLPILLTGCGRFKPAPLRHYVYVTAKSTFLRDRIAAVSNRTGNVVNGQRLQVLEQNRRFYRVETDKGEIGWLDERAVATEQVQKEFADLHKAHLHDVPVATGAVRDEVYLHARPGRDTDRLFREDEGEKLRLLARATTLKPQPPGVAVAAKRPSLMPLRSGKADTSAKADPTPMLAEPPPMDDWWLVRDAHDRTGWMLSRMLDTDVPDSIARYAENQRIVGAYVLNKVLDPEIQGASQEVPEYVVVLSPYKSGLPYDFDQLRVFYWNIHRHRYEGANRDRNIMGYLPVKVHTDPGTPPHNHLPATPPAPAYSYTVLPEGAAVPQPDSTTGIVKPTQLITKTYRLEGNNTRRVLPPGTPPPLEAHPMPEEEKKEKKGRRRR